MSSLFDWFKFAYFLIHNNPHFQNEVLRKRFGTSFFSLFKIPLEVTKNFKTNFFQRISVIFKIFAGVYAQISSESHVSMFSSRNV